MEQYENMIIMNYLEEIEEKLENNEMIQYLFNYNRDNLLNLSIIYDNNNLTKLLLKYDLNINHQNVNLNTCLHIACINNNFEILEILVQRDYIIFGLVNDQNMTPLDCAIVNNSIECVKIMVNYENIIDISNRKTPVMHAVDNNNIDILSILIPKNNPIFVNENNRYLNKNIETNCLLIYSIKSKHLNVVKFLFDNGLNIYKFKHNIKSLYKFREYNTPRDIYLFSTVNKCYNYIEDNKRYLTEGIHFREYNNHIKKYINTTLIELYYIITDNKLDDIKLYLSTTKYKINFVTLTEGDINWGGAKNLYIRLGDIKGYAMDENQTLVCNLSIYK